MVPFRLRGLKAGRSRRSVRATHYCGLIPLPAVIRPYNPHKLVLTPGARVGVYEVTAQIGAGGMGEVYRATDSNLKRSVAIKALSATVAGDADRLARFQREAEVLAALNHPNIGAIYGLEKTPDFTALVMELVEGEDLSQRIARGPIPLDEALPIAKQIADALEAAHERGIIHRDLKPANIKVRPDGTVKILDFGLAKAMEPVTGSVPSVSMSPTLSMHATQAGIILGTAAYMAPEQARGKGVDRRADIWAFGVVLFEMLTGSPPFPGEDISHVLARVIEREPAWSTLPPDLPPALATYLRRCLVKDPRQRVRDIGDVRLALEGAFEAAAPVFSIPGPRPTSAAARAVPWTLAASTAAFAIAWLAVWAPWRPATSVDRPLIRLDVDLGAGVSLPDSSTSSSSVAVSPDGSRLVYASDTPARLFTRRLDQPGATELRGTSGAQRPFFSADGQWVGFVVGNKLNKISVEGGAVVPLGIISGAMGGVSWDEDATVLLSDVLGKGLLRIPAGGGPPETLVGAGNGELGLVSPRMLPGGKAVLFAALSSLDVDTMTIEAFTLADRRRKVLVRGGQSPRYLPTSRGAGHLVYVNKNTLFAIPFDPIALETRGTAVPVLGDVAYNSGTLAGHFDVSANGMLVYRRASAGASAPTTLHWMDPSGKRETLPLKPGVYRTPRVSPDGKRVALTVADGGISDIWVYDTPRDVMTRLTFGGPTNVFPIWSPDGRFIVFSSYGVGIVQVRADGAGQPHALTQSRTPQVPWSFTPDGKRLAFEEVSGSSRTWTVPLEVEGGQLKAGTPELFPASSSDDQASSFSPDGRWLAYQSKESGTNEVYVRAFPPSSSGQGGKWQISNSGGMQPHWSRSGRDLLYQSGDQILAAGYTVNGDTFAAAKPRVWIARLGAAVTPNFSSVWDMAPDGGRVIVVTLAESGNRTPEHEVVFLQNFFDELRRRVPIGK